MIPQPDPARLERVRKDLEHIRQLKQSEAWSLYFTRRMAAKREKMMHEFLHEPMPPEAREALRQRILFLDEITGLPDNDERSALSELKGAQVLDPR